MVCPALFSFFKGPEKYGNRKGGPCGLFKRIYESFPTPILGNHFIDFIQRVQIIPSCWEQRCIFVFFSLHCLLEFWGKNVNEILLFYFPCYNTTCKEEYVPVGEQGHNPFCIYASVMSFNQWDADSNGGNSHLVEVWLFQILVAGMHLLHPADYWLFLIDSIYGLTERHNKQSGSSQNSQTDENQSLILWSPEISSERDDGGFTLSRVIGSFRKC